MQEITGPARFTREAQARLGPEWRFVYDGSANQQRVGVLYDGSRYALAWSRDRRETLIDGRHKVSLDVRLRALDGGSALRLFVVHLKAGGEWADIRRQQLRQLAPVVREATESWDEVMVLGDFNATGAADRESLAWFAEAKGLHWASERSPARATGTVATDASEHPSTMCSRGGPPKTSPRAARVRRTAAIAAIAVRRSTRR